MTTAPATDQALRVRTLAQSLHQSVADGDDALALARAIGLHGATPGALQAYESERLAPGRAVVERARALGAYLQAQARDGSASIVIGTRSALFTPMPRLGIIIVDEEHDGSYKQQDPAPRYKARDTAIYYANKLNAKVILGSATPSVESFYNAENKKGMFYHHQKF